jgi:hypothetical protein
MKRGEGEHELRAAAGREAAWCGESVHLYPGAERTQTTHARATDLDLLRLSCVCRADARLQGHPDRSRVLATIHRFFDDAPEGTPLDELLFSALVDRAPRLGRGLLGPRESR